MCLQMLNAISNFKFLEQFSESLLASRITKEFDFVFFFKESMAAARRDSYPTMDPATRRKSLSSLLYLSPLSMATHIIHPSPTPLLMGLA